MNLLSYLFEHPVLEEIGLSARRTARHRYQQDLSLALVSAGGFHLAVLLTALLLASQRTPQPPTASPRDPWVFGSPPTIGGQQVEPIISPPVPAPPQPPAQEDGILVPVRDDAPPDTSVAAPDPDDWDLDGTSLNGGVRGNGPPGTGGGGGDGVGPGDGGGYPPPDTLIVVEIEPVLVEQPLPDYPELARMTRIEGKVIVRVLVGKDGKVKDAILIQGAHPMLEEAALLAARSAVFKPAIQQGHPVAVWVTIPFRFSLR